MMIVRVSNTRSFNAANKRRVSVDEYAA